jgi:prolyl oligopeptidase PreP (S9A serine peptidase family)
MNFCNKLKRCTVRSELAVLLKYKDICNFTHGHVHYSVKIKSYAHGTYRVQTPETIMKPEVYYAVAKFVPEAVMGQQS